MEIISDDFLVEVYNKAIELNLSRDFILLLENELKKRKLDPEKH